MQLDFQFERVRYMLNFECADCQKNENGNSLLELRVYHSLGPGSTYASSLKLIKDNEIIFNDNDDYYVPKEAQKFCNRMVKLLVFA